MATASEIIVVRQNTNEPDNVAPFTDAVIEELIDASGVDLASATIWRRKAATASEMVDVTEAGASRKASDLFKNAIAMAEHFEDSGGLTEQSAPRAKVHVIDRLA